MSTRDILEQLRTQLDGPNRVLLEILVQRAEEAEVRSAELSAQLSKVLDELAALRRELFGRRSERGGRVEPVQSEVRRAATAAEVERITQQLAEAENRATPTDDDRKKAKNKEARARSNPARDARAKQRRKLPVTAEYVRVAEAQLPAGISLDEFVSFGATDTVVRYEYVRAHFVQVVYTLEKLQHRDNPSLIVQASAPPTPVAGGLYGPGVYAAIVVSRCLDSMPLHRIATAYNRQGLPIAPSTVGSLFHRAAFLLRGVHTGIRKHVQQAELVHADETPQPMLAPRQTRQAWMWMACCRDAITYEFSPSRSGEVARKLLGDGAGRLMVDGYSGYGRSADATDKTPRERLACWAHARRLFWRLHHDWHDAREVLDLIRDLYHVEHRAAERGLSPDARRLLRHAESRPILEQIRAWLDKHDGQHSPASKQHKAVAYSLTRWTELTRLVEDGTLPLDNNIAERALRIVALGRKNSLFVGPDDNGQSLAILLSVAHTCRLHGIDVQAYLEDVLPRLAQADTRDNTPYLPWNWAAGERKAVATGG